MLFSAFISETHNYGMSKGGTHRPKNNQPCNGRTYVIRLWAVTEIIHSLPHSGRPRFKLCVHSLIERGEETEEEHARHSAAAFMTARPLHLQRLPTPVAYVSENVSPRMSHSARSRDKAGMTNVFCGCVSEFTLTRETPALKYNTIRIHSKWKFYFFLIVDIMSKILKRWTSTRLHRLSTSRNSNI